MNNTSLYQLIFENRMNQKIGIDLHFHSYDRFDRRVTKIDMGRQSGKTTAILRTMADNKKFDFIMLTHSGQRAMEVAKRYKELYLMNNKISDHTNLVVISGNGTLETEKALNNHLRLHSDRTLVVFVEESMKHTSGILETLRNHLSFREREYRIFVVGCQ